MRYSMRFFEILAAIYRTAAIDFSIPTVAITATLTYSYLISFTKDFDCHLITP